MTVYPTAWYRVIDGRVQEKTFTMPPVPKGWHPNAKSARLAAGLPKDEPEDAVRRSRSPKAE